MHRFVLRQRISELAEGTALTAQRLVSQRKSCYEIDTEAVVPVHLANTKEEYSAATLLNTKALTFIPGTGRPGDLSEGSPPLPKPTSASSRTSLFVPKGQSHFLIQDLLPSLKVDRCVPPSQFYYGGRKKL